MDVEDFLAAAGELLSVPSTADRPAELERALGYVLDFVGTGFTVERFTSAGKPSALVYPEGRDAAERPRFRVILNAHLDVVPAPPEQFRPRRDGMRLYARGAQDMKVSALAEALAFRELAGSVGSPTSPRSRRTTRRWRSSFRALGPARRTGAPRGQRRAATGTRWPRGQPRAARHPTRPAGRIA